MEGNAKGCNAIRRGMHAVAKCEKLRTHELRISRKESVISMHAGAELNAF